MSRGRVVIITTRPVFLLVVWHWFFSTPGGVSHRWHRSPCCSDFVSPCADTEILNPKINNQYIKHFMHVDHNAGTTIESSERSKSMQFSQRWGFFFFFLEAWNLYYPRCDLTVWQLVWRLSGLTPVVLNAAPEPRALEQGWGLVAQVWQTRFSLCQFQTFSPYTPRWYRPKWWYSGPFTTF